jgi:hypothetical protein
MGITSLSHYQSITVHVYLPPLLHGRMGTISAGLDMFGDFIKMEVEPIGQDTQISQGRNEVSGRFDEEVRLAQNHRGKYVAIQAQRYQ